MTGEYLFWRAVRSYSQTAPPRIMLRDRDRAVSYAESDRLIGRIAGGLSRLGLGQGDRLVVLLPNGIDYVLIWLAAERLGIVLVPINTALRGNGLRHQIALAAATIALVGNDMFPAVCDLAAELPDLRHVVVAGEGVGLPGPWSTSSLETVFSGPAGPEVAVEPSDPAAIFFTSGTTGPSKGVLTCHGQAAATARPMAEQLTPDDVFYWFNPMFHVALPHMIGATLLAGGTVALRERFSTTSFWADVDYFGATATMLLGAAAEFVANREPAADDSRHTLRKVFMVPLVRDVDGFEARFNVRVMSWFNMTEASTPIHTHGFVRPDGRSCGRVREGAEAIVADEHDNPVSDGLVGELLVRTARSWEMSLGYWQNSEATAAAWRNQWFHTGDLFVRDAGGNFTFIDRAKDSIRRRGENISSWEVEQEIVAHPEASEAAVVAVPSPHGEDDVLAHVVCTPSSTLTAGALHAFLRPRLARFMVPRFIVLGTSPLPRTPTGKVQKDLLRGRGTRDAWDAEAEAADGAR